MPVYFGFPVTIREAYRLFDVKFEETERTWFLQGMALQHLDTHFENLGLSIQLYSTDKGQCIVGYEIEEVSNVWSKFINVDEFINKLTTLKETFAQDINKYIQNFSEVTLEYMEGEPEKISFPIPYIIEYN